MKTSTFLRFKDLFCLLCLVLGAHNTWAQTTFIGFKSTGWKYREAHQDAAAIGNGSWKTNAYNDAAWASGQAPLGYEDILTTPPKPLINTWLRPTNTHGASPLPRTHYFRKSLTVVNPAQYSGYRIKTWCDDGLVVYVNGAMVFSHNMPATTIDSLTLASMTAPNDSLYGEITINSALPGTNVIAVEVHQSSNSSVDRYFDLMIEGISAPATCPEWPVAYKSTGWKYREGFQDAAAIGNGSWKTNAYNDAAWASGQGTLGYEDGSLSHAIATWLWPLSGSRNGNNSSKTHYFRKCFNITDKSPYSGYRIRTWCDDGMVAYVNGREVFRLNMPATTIDSLTAAVVAPPNDSIYKDTTVYIPADLLNGTNIIAVEVHQAGTSIDRYFDLSIQGVSGCAAATLERQPYLQVGTPTSVIVRWKTDVMTNTKVKYGTSPGNLTNEVFNNTNDSVHIVNLTGLLPNTKYYYSVGYTCGMTDQVLASGVDYYYHSMPNNNTEPLRFWILGDVCSGDNRQTNVRDAYMNYLGNNRLHGIIFGGDNSKKEPYDGKDQALDHNFFPIYANQLRNMVSWISLGNHDYGPRPYNDSLVASYNAFSYPTQAEAGGVVSNSKGYYSFDAGDAHFIVLNPYHPDFLINRGSAIPGCMPPWDCAAAQGRKNMFMLKFDSPATQQADFNAFQQIKWLKADLINTTKKWKIVFFHTPPYTKGSHDSDPAPSDWGMADGELKVVRELLVPVLEQYNVDLIVTSHTHSYARSFLMRGVTGTPTKAQFRANPNQLLEFWSGKYTPSSKPYIKQSNNYPSFGTVHVVTGNAGRGSAGPDGAADVPATPHPVMYYSDSSAALLASGGSVELLITKNRLDVKYLKLNSDAGITHYIKDEFTIMKEVSKKITYNNPVLPLTLTASWEGTYSWKIAGGANLPNTTQSIPVSPIGNTTYIVNDGYNGGNGFLADTFIVNVCAPTLTLNSTVSASTVYQASQWIKGTNTNIIAPNATVEYRAGYIELKPSGNGTAFLATPANGFYFLALPVGCNPGGGGGAPAPTEKKANEGLLPPAINAPKKEN